ncbi:hypothetical protein BDZ91DRAFT_807424 [Kalaharituber pfeilii]|nr:hypothetical protein BDZ91DRAFT_807424 [Kalaharituber pfeilii]
MATEASIPSARGQRRRRIAVAVAVAVGRTAQLCYRELRRENGAGGEGRARARGELYDSNGCSSAVCLNQTALSQPDVCVCSRPSRLSPHRIPRQAIPAPPSLWPIRRRQKEENNRIEIRTLLQPAWRM